MQRLVTLLLCVRRCCGGSSLSLPASFRAIARLVSPDVAAAFVARVCFLCVLECVLSVWGVCG